jgi:hypothetical protein
MSNYSEFFLNTDSNVVQLELIEISHPSFSKTYRIVRNAIDGVTVTLEDSTIATFDYYPLQIKPTTTSDDLDQKLDIQLGDVGDVVPGELDLINIAGTFPTKPTLIYRTYRSDDLSQPLYGPFRYEVSSISSKNEGSALSAGAPKVNQNATGESYSMDRFPMLRGFL